MKKIVSSLFISLFLTISCSNENTNISGTDENVSTFNDVVSKIYNSQAKNHILIENLGGIYTKERIYNISSRSIGSEPLNLYLEGKNIYGKVVYSKEGNSWFSEMNNSSLFGKKIQFIQKDGKLILSTTGNIAGKS